MIFDVYFPATVHAAYTHRQRARGLIISRDMKRVPTRLVGNVTVRWSIYLGRTTTGSPNSSSLRGRRLKGKDKGVLGVRETRGAREEEGRKGRE